MGKRFRQLTQTATDADLVEGNYFGVDTPNVTKKVPANLIAKSSDVSALKTNIDNISASLAPEYDPDVGADNGKLYTHEGAVYLCKTTCTGPWSAGNFEAYDFGKLYNDVNGYVTLLGDISLDNPTTGYFYSIGGILTANADSAYKDVAIDSILAGHIIQVTVHGKNTNQRYTMLVDSNGTIMERFKINDVVPSSTGTHTATYTFKMIPQEGWTLKCSWAISTGASTAASVDITKPLDDKIAEIAKIANKTIYVATNGDDVNDGSLLYPKKTVSAAILAGASIVILSGGVYDDNTLDFSKSLCDKIIVKGATGERIVFKRRSSRLYSAGDEIAVSGSTKVYYISLANDPKYSDNESNQWLYFDDLDDVSTAIPASEAHPLQRGQFYRCDCTKISRCVSSTLADAIAEMEGAEDYRWFYDTDSNRLYFSRSENDTSVCPIYRPVGTYLLTRENQSLELSNLDFRYGCLNLRKLNIVNLYGVAVKYPRNDCYSYNDTLNIRFERCEACQAHNDNLGDGFNGHVTSGTDIMTKYCTASIIECWSHDCVDDGYSDHEYSETIIDGGLFEYNGKAGVTPAVGSHCVCKNVYSRHNYNGFNYTGEANDGGNSGQMICYNCISESNDNTTAVNNGFGFMVSGATNKVILINCKSINNKVGFYAGPGTILELIDCGVKDSILYDTSGEGTFVIKQTTAVE